MRSLNFFPVGLDLRGRTCIVVGGGRVGTRKVAGLLSAGARVVLVSPEGTDEVSDWSHEGTILWERRPYRAGDLEGAFLVVLATDDRELNGRIAAESRTSGTLVCDASAAGRSDLIFGALHRSPSVTVAVFTDGKDPTRARRVRDRLAELETDWSEE